jgi:hypothetical protein
LENTLLIFDNFCEYPAPTNSLVLSKALSLCLGEGGELFGINLAIK